MLALDDGALARICIAASAVPNHARSKWLQRIASQLDPTQSAKYSRTWWERKRNGLSLYRVELDEVAVAEMLTREGLLPANTDVERTEVEQALQAFICKLLELSER